MENTCKAKPITYQRNLAKLPKALAPLIEREQWRVWHWMQKSDESWQKPPLMALQPERYASTNDPNTWTDYATALATVQAKQADGIVQKTIHLAPLISIIAVAQSPIQLTYGRRIICRLRFILIRK